MPQARFAPMYLSEHPAAAGQVSWPQHPPPTTPPVVAPSTTNRKRVGKHLIAFGAAPTAPAYHVDAAPEGAKKPREGVKKPGEGSKKMREARRGSRPLFRWP
jgi:hypothetical protein